MAKPRKAKSYWIDRLCEKHECWTYDTTQTIAATHEGKPIKIILPAYLPEMKVLTTAEKDDRLFVVGRQFKAWDKKEHLGVMLVAKRVEKDTFAAVVWHELFPWALKYLDLVKNS